MKRALYFTGIILLLQSYLFVMDLQGQTEKKRTQKIFTNDHYKYISINEVLMWVSNNGDGSHDPRTDGNGFYWPGGEFATKSAIFEDGLVYGGKVNGQIRVNGNTYRQGLQAGKIISPGVADDPTLSKYRVYRIRRDWETLPPGQLREELEKDYNEWPVEDGAPWEDVDGDGIFSRGTDKPKFDGDEVLWYVANDLDSSRTHFTYGSEPVGLEFQTTIYGLFSDSSSVFGNVVFKKYKIINKSEDVISELYLTYFADVDLGDASDDYIGFDTTLQLGYTYNGDNDDGGGGGNSYGFAPPAVGHMILQSPAVISNMFDSAYFNGRWNKGYKNIKMNATGINLKNSGGGIYPRDVNQGVYEGTLEWYNLMRGLNNDGAQLLDPTTGQFTVYPLCGDPVNQTGWYEGNGWPGGPNPADRRLHTPVGPLTMMPNDTIEVVYAIFMSKGSNNINSIARLKQDAAVLREIYTTGFNNAPEIDKLNWHAYTQENKILLWWSDESEYFDLVDKRISYKNLSDSTYTFEGYKIWQYSDSLGNNPTLVKIFDKQNDVFFVRDYVLIDGIREYVTVLNSPNHGLKRYFEIDQSAITQTQLYNGSPYYFSVNAFAYSEHSFPKILESIPQIKTIIPGRSPIDNLVTYDSGDTITMQQTSGKSDMNAKLYVIDPTALTGDKYELEMRDSSGQYFYSFYNRTKNDTLIKKSSDYNIEPFDKIALDGMLLFVQINDSVRNSFAGGRIKEVIELKGPGGVPVSQPQSVFGELNSTGQWELQSIGFNGTVGNMSGMNYRNNIGTRDYEIRFTATGSEYYTTGYSAANPTLSSNPKGKGRVPFEIWQIDREPGSVPKRLMIKTGDNYPDSPNLRDTTWSQNPATKIWESVYCYEDNNGYNEPLPNFSGTSSAVSHRFGHLAIVRSLPAEGTVIRINTYKPPVTGDVFTAVATAATRNNFENAKQNIDKITIFPNPYFGSSSLEAGGTERIVRLTNLPQNVILRIYSLAGVFIKRIDKETPSPWLDWDLRKEDGSLVGSGIYLLYLDMPGIGTKILKLAVVQSN